MAQRLRLGEISPRDFVDWADRRLGRTMAGVEGKQGRGPSKKTRAPGAHATPWPLASWVARQAGVDAGSILDPACGCGHLLVAAALQRQSPPRPEAWYGWDISPECVHATRIGLWLASGRAGRVADFCHIRWADALLDAPPVKVRAIVANPPFVSIRALNRDRGRRYVERLRRAFPELRGNFDLYVPFLLRLLPWLDAGGRFACIVPASLWSSEYSRGVREALVPHLHAVHRLGDRAFFPKASVSPQVLVGGTELSGEVKSFQISFESGDCIAVSEKNSFQTAGNLPASTDNPEDTPPEGPVRSRSLGIHLDRHRARALSTGTVPLGEIAEIQAGTAGYQARAIADHLLEETRSEGQQVLPFVMSRCIEPYRLHSGPLRFLGTRWHSPMLPVRVLTAGKRRLFEAKKILVAGISRDLEAAWDDRGRALGVGVYAILSSLVRPECLLALLNNKQISRWYRYRFVGKELSGGYFAVNCSSLTEIPVPSIWLADEGSTELLCSLVRQRSDWNQSRLHPHLDRQIARIVEGSWDSPVR